MTKTKTAEMKQESRPFEETIIGAIRRCPPARLSGETIRLLKLIRETRVLKNYDEVIATIDKYFGDYNLDEIEETKTMILTQKQAAETAATDLASSFDFNGKERALMVVIEKIIGILQNLTPTTLSNTGLKNRINDTFKLFETAKKISRAANEQDFQATIAELQSQ